MRQGPVEQMNVKGSDVVSDSQWGSERQMLRLPPPFYGLWRGLAGFLTQTVMLRCSGGRKVVLKAQTLPAPCCVLAAPSKHLRDGEGGCGHTLITSFELELTSSHALMGFPGGARGTESNCQCRRRKRRGFDPWVRKITWRRAWQSTPVFLPRKSHGQRSLVGYTVHRVAKGRT